MVKVNNDGKMRTEETCVMGHSDDYTNAGLRCTSMLCQHNAICVSILLIQTTCGEITKRFKMPCVLEDAD